MNFTFPNQPEAERITIRSSAPDSRTSPPVTRVAPTHDGAMPKLESDSAPVITAVPGADHDRRVQIRPRPGASFLDQSHHPGPAVETRRR
jgi:hypothetical protein